MSVIQVVRRLLGTPKRPSDHVEEILVLRTDTILEALNKLDWRVEQLESLLRQALSLEVDQDSNTNEHAYDRLRKLQEALDAQIGTLVVNPVKIPEDFRADNLKNARRPIQRRPNKV